KATKTGAVIITVFCLAETVHERKVPAGSLLPIPESGLNVGPMRPYTATKGVVAAPTHALRRGCQPPPPRASSSVGCPSATQAFQTDPGSGLVLLCHKVHCRD